MYFKRDYGLTEEQKDLQARYMSLPKKKSSLAQQSGM